MQIDIDCESPCYLSNHQVQNEWIFHRGHLIEYAVLVLYYLHSTKLHQLRVALPDPGHLR